MAQRQDPTNFANYRLADEAHTNANMIDRAVNAASGRPGDPGMFTPAQLASAAKSGQKYAGRGDIADLAEDAVKVLPSSVPNPSGTAAHMLMAGGLGSLAAGGGAAIYNDHPIAGLAALAAAAPFSKTGQAALRAILIGERNPLLASIGKKVLDNPSVPGALGVGLPLQLLPQGQQ